ncbi:glutathione-disulfide reductase [Denitromonas ohlonensis]|uniref:Glutathione-disulfide reductase n=2 Tax=Denitromonas TaxID=139331 RepID=A0A557RS74_9RHOO|nr:glutathione-disulfide reductase [Denitromonas ohlonensis]TVO68027.1 glutathione-disulfide reductase [Denitromonas ohlonensis]TVO78068.1 glutathione-disulfide reductase [Denitromonas ohlonensis]
MSDYDFDLITIGAGSGGVAASRRAAVHGARVAICEGDRVGGTCVIRGCVPKKLLMYASQFADAFADAPGFGWEIVPPSFDLAALTAAKDRETARLETIYRKMLADAKVTLLEGQARLVDAHTVDIGGRHVSAGHILIATGGTPSAPAIDGLDLAISSNELLDLTELPRRLLVLGAGYIAVEFAGIFAGFGSEVIQAYRADLPLRGFDDDIRTRLATAMSERGVALRPGFAPVKLERSANGIRCTAKNGEVIEADVVLSALGRRPNTDGLGLAEVGVDVDAKSGAIRVSPDSRTTVDSIYAVGDVTDRAALTPVAIAEGRAFADTVFANTPRVVDHRLIATAVFSQPSIGTIGLSEPDAIAAGHQVTVFEADFRPMKHTLAGRTERAYMKVIVDAGSDKVLGAHLIGADSGEIIQALAIAITMGATKADLDRTLAVHPTSAEELVLLRTPRA